MLSGFLLWRQRHTLSPRYYKDSKPKPTFGLQGPEFAQPFMMYPPYLHHTSRSARSSVHSQASSQYTASQVLTPLTVPATMSMSNAPTHSVAGMTHSDFYTSGRRTPLPEEQASATIDVRFTVFYFLSTSLDLSSILF